MTSIHSQTTAITLTPELPDPSARVGRVLARRYAIETLDVQARHIGVSVSGRF